MKRIALGKDRLKHQDAKNTKGHQAPEIGQVFAPRFRGKERYSFEDLRSLVPLVSWW